jgi:hypothetical protein
MNFFVAVTDYDWFQLHASKSRVDKVNFGDRHVGARKKQYLPGCQPHRPESQIPLCVALQCLR